MNDLVHLDGMDWIAVLLDRITRKTAGRPYAFSIELKLAHFIDPNVLENRIRNALQNVSPLLAGRPQGTGIVFLKNCEPVPFTVCKNREELENKKIGKIPNGFFCDFSLLTTHDASFLLTRFSHLLFDGIGAELLLNKILNNETIVPEIRTVPYDAADVRRAGRTMGQIQMELQKKSTVYFPYKRKSAQKFYSFSIPSEIVETRRKSVEEKYGPFSFSLHVFSTILMFSEKLFEKNRVKGDYLLIPMSVDLRKKNGLSGEIFLNRWSVMPLAVRRSELHEPERAFSEVRNGYLTGLGNDYAGTALRASHFLLRFPQWLLGVFPKLFPRTTYGSVMFSFLDDTVLKETVFGTVTELFHFPIMPPNCGFGVFCKLHNGSLCITLSEGNGSFSPEETDSFWNDLNHAFLTGDLI